jgi:hypothetical protein
VSPEFTAAPETPSIAAGSPSPSTARSSTAAALRRPAGGRADQQDGPERLQACGRRWAGCGIPSTSPRATTRHPGRRPGRIAGGWHRMLRPGCRAAGLRQVDGMPHGPQRGEERWLSPFVSRSSGRPPGADNAEKRRSAPTQLTGGVGASSQVGALPRFVPVQRVDAAVMAARTQELTTASHSRRTARGHRTARQHRPASRRRRSWTATDPSRLTSLHCASYP